MRKSLNVTLLVLNLVVITSSIAAERVTLQTIPIGANVYINGEYTRRKTPTKVQLRRGDAIELRLPNYEVFKTRFNETEDVIKAVLKQSKSMKLILTTKTGNRNWADTSGVTLAVYLNGNPKFRGKLDNPRVDDFQVGSFDQFSFDFEFPIADLKGLRFIMEKGGDAWFFDSVKVEVQTENGIFNSRPLVLPVKAWISADLKKADRRQHVDVSLNNLKLFDTGAISK